MAPADTPRGKKARENQFFDPGVRGRKTGLTLVDTGIRDEHGLEPMEGIFSSPEKGSARTAARKSNGTVTTSEDMEVANSSAPEPTEVLTGRRLARNAQGLLPLPTGRSPIKTNLGATPKRGSSVGAQSPFKSARSARAASHPAVNRRLDFSSTEIEASAERPRNGLALTNDDRDVFDLPDDDIGDGAGPATIYEEESEVLVNGTMDDSVGQQMGKDLVDDDTLQGAEVRDGGVVAVLEVVEKKRPGRKRKSGSLLATTAGEIDAQDATLSLIDDSQTAPVAKKRRGRPPRAQSVEPPMDEELPDTMMPDEVEAMMEDQIRNETEQADEVDAPEPPKTRGRKKKTPAERNPNAKVVSGRANKAANAGAKQSSFKRPSAPRAGQRYRSQTPGNDDETTHTRSGRLVYKPLKDWLGEKVILADVDDPRDAPSSGLQVTTGFRSVQEIIRAEDITPAKPSHRAYRRRARSSSTRNKSVFGGDEDDAEQEESWELDEGIVSGSVRMWDAEAGVVVDEEEEDQQLAFAANKIEPRPTPDNPNFCFTKTLTKNFFGAGIIELPPHGYKGTKNSRRFQFLFFVHYGKVAVEVAGNRFIITKGGMWQVPRGNFYSITNETDRPARIVFAQGCEMDAQSQQARQTALDQRHHGDGDTSAVTASMVDA